MTRSGGNAVLTWNASTAGSSGIACYYIYRDGGALPFARVPGSTLTYSDIVGYTVAHSYTVVACSGAGLLSSPSASANITTATPPTYTLTVTSNKATPVTSIVVVQTDALPTPIDDGQKTATSAASAVWNGLPYGWYKVTATCGSEGPTSQTVFLNATTTVPFTF